MAKAVYKADIRNQNEKPTAKESRAWHIAMRATALSFCRYFCL